MPNKNSIERVCELCGGELPNLHPRRRFCSAKCGEAVWRANNNDHIRQYTYKWRMENSEYVKKVSKESYVKYRDKYIARNKKYYKENMHKISAHWKVAEALKRGKLIKTPCVECGTTIRVQGHHEDYDKPLDVIWLCHRHHRARHNPPVRATQEAK